MKTALKYSLLTVVWMSLALTGSARIKLVALPERTATVIRLDNPQATLVSEERVLTLQKGVNKVDFSWKGVFIDPDSIRLMPLSHPDKVVLLNVSYPPAEEALVWEISSAEAWEETVRITYLLSNIDRLITYKGTVDKEETKLDLQGFIILRNFSGEDFDRAQIVLAEGAPVTQTIGHEETRQLPFMKVPGVPFKKVWTFDAARLPWDPKTRNENVGIPVTYQIVNAASNSLGQAALWGGKCRVFQQDGHESTIFSGEDMPPFVPVGETMKIGIGDSRDIVVTQRQMEKKDIPLKKNSSQVVVLYDTDEVVTAKIENFKDKPAALTLVEHIKGQWDMKECSLKYKRKNAETLEFEIDLPPHGKQELTMHFQRRNLRPGPEPVLIPLESKD